MPQLLKRRTMTTIALALLFACGTAGSETGQVVRVVDGDTLIVRIFGGKERVRLIGVDAPESVRPDAPVEWFGEEASAFTKRLAEGKSVRLVGDPRTANRDKYNRLLRYVYLPDGRHLNAEIIRQGYGHAFTWHPFSKLNEFRALEREAREAKRGLWADGGAITIE
jgi:micrococcal nuclease